LAGGSPDWQLHSDDYTFVTVDGQTEAYLTRAHLYRDLLGWVPGVAQRLSSTQRLQLEFFGRLRRGSGQRLKWPVRFPLDGLWPQREPAAEAKLAGVFLLARTSESELKVSRLDDEKDVIDGLIKMNFDEARHYRTLLLEVFPGSQVDSLIEEWGSRERAVLQSVCREVPLFQLALPRASAPDSAMAAGIEAAVLSSIEAVGR
ncbi:MAG: hypothetical protein WBR18_07340, partial [Anaerolineales bacterium]